MQPAQINSFRYRLERRLGWINNQYYSPAELESQQHPLEVLNDDKTAVS
jgi:hypothetical protein